ncbi:sigma-54-dependent Fis family transcriptional regulator [Aquincola tertiaricarbonis]|uniref:Sigma-54-dependent Fis family transcriptional regulator n=1 Tax=Aquincola tertiaricarbonis TaxID=391953 RepID=A0ABY4S5V1_AQUTE|nr:sigma-54-dependent Fis family transcriptional regulator [Aquincola tertiaricarbonis]URI06695.1 sigma-54-dependent Fis family transcriptional regulator [Aquincola tertiaricarbonis]
MHVAPAALAAPTSRAAPLALADPLHSRTIQQSHERCAALGLGRMVSPDHSPGPQVELQLARERNLRLHLHALPVMELLLEQTMASQSMVLLTDACGTVLHSVGHDSFLQRASRVALAPGANWAESNKGTNAIGTALVEEAPTLVHADEHYMHANGFLTCSAAPIFDPRGNLLGVLDVSGEKHSYHLHTMGLVKMSARMIENHWLADDFRHALRLHFHSRPEFIGTLMEGIVAVDRDGRLIGANRSALDQLRLSSAALRMKSLPMLLNLTVGAVVDHFRSPMAPPMTMLLPDGQRLAMRAVFNWPTWHRLGSLSMDAEPAGQVVDAGAMEAGTADRGGLFAAGLRSTGTTGAEPGGAPTLSGLRYLQTGDAQMEAVITKVRRVIDRDIAILVLGETGTGKELLARAIHHDSQRARQPFVAVNCASIPESLIEAELFGYEDGAFTGARRKGAPGKILQANGGTLFLDEIGDMPLALQARLLRVLQERQVTPLGSARAIPVDVAVVAATHRHLREMIEAHSFREDLYYRLNGLVVRLPALRERSDLMQIVRKILRAEVGHRVLEPDADVTALLQAYHWPGNIRQLSNVLRTAAVMAGGENAITREHLSDDFLEDAECSLQRAASRAAPPATTGTDEAAAPLQPTAQAPAPADHGGTLEELELLSIRRAVDEAGGNISVASRRLGISRNTIYRKLRWNAPAKA